MLGLLQRFFGGRGESGEFAKNRLQFVLVQDRAGLSNEELAKFKGELISVIEKYFEVDRAAFDISYRRETEQTTLQINSPVLVRRAEKRKAEVIQIMPAVTPIEVEEVTPSREELVSAP